MKSKRSERGASVVEYALLIALVTAAAIGSLRLLGDSAEGRLDHAAEAIGEPDAGGPLDAAAPRPAAGREREARTFLLQ